MLRKSDSLYGEFRLIQSSVWLAAILTAWTVASVAAAQTPASGADVSLAVDIYVDWGSGACAEGVVTNSGSASTVWELQVELVGSVTSYWDSDIRYSMPQSAEGSGLSHSWSVVGDSSNRSLEPGAETTFGFCIDRTLEPEIPSPADPGMPPMEDHTGHDDGSHDQMPPAEPSGDYIDITTWGNFHGSNHNSESHELVGGRTAITTEAHEAYNNLRAFLGLSDITIEEVGEWAFAEALTNNSQAWGNDLQGVGLWYAMQGAKVGWITDEAYDPQILADIQRIARTVADLAEMKALVMDMVHQYGHTGYADYLEQYGIEDTFINTLKMEPHYGGWMHGRTHGFRSIEGVAINHDINHLTVLGWDQMQPFMNDTFDWPQWDALNVSDSGVIEYFQSMVSLGDPVGLNLEFDSTPITPPATETPSDPSADPPGTIDGGLADFDLDGVVDNQDNCSEVPNGDQFDGDMDGYGNVCDFDLNNDGGVGLDDVAIAIGALGSINPVVDYDGSQSIGLDDLAMVISAMGSVAGPSGLACAGTVPCPAP